MDNDKQLEKYKIIWTKIKGFKNSELSDLPVCDNNI